MTERGLLFRFRRRHDGSFGPPRHWYFITEFYCPQCGRSTEHRERRLGARPADNKRRRLIEAWDGCGV